MNVSKNVPVSGEGIVKMKIVVFGFWNMFLSKNISVLQGELIGTMHLQLQ